MAITLSVINIFFISFYIYEKKSWENRAVERLQEKVDVIAQKFDNRLIAMLDEHKNEWNEKNTEWSQWMIKVKDQWWSALPSFKSEY